MIREQKRALTILTSTSVAAVLAVSAVMMKVLHLHWLSILLVVSVAVAACAGGIVYFRLRPKAGAIAFDERDREIQRNAALASMGTAYPLLMAASFAAYYVLGETASIPITWLPLVLAGAGLCQVYAFFVSLFLQYGRGGRDEQ